MKSYRYLIEIVQHIQINFHQISIFYNVVAYISNSNVFLIIYSSLCVFQKPWQETDVALTWEIDEFSKVTVYLDKISWNQEIWRNISGESLPGLGLL
jgi:hypothetical protein